MAEYIEREAAIRALQPTHAPAINEVLASVIRRIPAADVVSKEQYDHLLRAARRMHEWIFLNSCDELEAYRECGLTDEDNALLGYIGQIQLEVKTREEAEAAIKGGQDDV